MEFAIMHDMHLQYCTNANFKLCLISMEKVTYSYYGNNSISYFWHRACIANSEME